MRIIGGAHKKRKILPPKGLKERPTTDRAKEGLFNLLENRCSIDELQVLELFAGTGSIAYEFCSRGAPEVTTVERDRRLCAFIEKTAQEMGMDQLKVRKGDALRFIEGCEHRYDLIFADPPYGEERTYQKLLERILNGSSLLGPKGLLILEHDERFDPEGWEELEETRRFGNSRFSFFVP